jgi:integrase
VTRRTGAVGRQAAARSFGHGVVLYPPSGSFGYYRLQVTRGGRRVVDTSAGRDPQAAEAKARDLASRYAAGTQDRAGRPQREMVAAFLAANAEAWSRRYARDIAANLNRRMRPYLDRTVAEFDVEEVDAVICSAPSPESGALAKRHLSSLAGWAARHRWLTPEQVGLVAPAGWVPPAGYRPRPVRSASPRARARGYRTQGEGRLWLPRDQVPTAEQVNALAAACGERPAAAEWGELWVQFVAHVGGQRLSESLAAEVDDLDRREELVRSGERTSRRAIPWWRIHQQLCEVPPAQAESDAPGPWRAPCKGGKIREAPVPARTPTGYPLQERLTKRIAAVRRQGGTLLFPAPDGRAWWGSNFRRSVLNPSLEAAGWPVVVSEGGRRVRDWSSHALRHFFAVACVEFWKLEARRPVSSAGGRAMRWCWSATTARAGTPEYRVPCG